ncbi:hypothetical protein [Streptomyces sp. NPDC059819]|uniref:hypothetical protein n=1 Tax=Streptomyces sp. NPDC059819 TaxID=3346963 RepID=UPI003663E4D4
MDIDQRSAFAAEVSRMAKRYRNAGRTQAVTKHGYTVLFTGLGGNHVEAVTVTDPEGHQVRRADGWKVSETAEVAAFLWDELKKSKARGAERERLAGLKSVSITSVDAIGPAWSKEADRYHLTPEQLGQLHALAEEMASANVTVTAAE